MIFIHTCINYLFFFFSNFKDKISYKNFFQIDDFMTEIIIKSYWLI